MSVPYLAKIKKLDSDNAKVVVLLTVLDAQSLRIPETPGFALQLIHNDRWRGSVISEEISYDDLLREKWNTQYASGFVLDCSIKAKRNFENYESIPEDDSKWQFRKQLPQAILEIKFSHSDWFKHLVLEEEWESVAYDTARKYDACTPILPVAKIGSTINASEDLAGWKPIPSFLFDQGKTKLPKVLYFPRYTSNAYKVSKSIQFSDENIDELHALHGKFVWHEKDDQVGIFVWNDLLKVYRIYEMGDRYEGYRSYHNPGDVGNLSLLTYCPDTERKSPKLSYMDLFLKAKPLIKSVKLDGNLVTLNLLGIYDIDALELDKAKVLKMLSNNFIETFNHETELDGDYPLSKFLRYITVKEDSDNFNSLLPKYADGIIKRFKIVYPKHTYSDYDNMSDEELIHYFEEEKWPTYGISIEVYDAAFLDQLINFETYSLTIRLGFILDPIVEWEKRVYWEDYKHLV